MDAHSAHYEGPLYRFLICVFFLSISIWSSLKDRKIRMRNIHSHSFAHFGWSMCFVHWVQVFVKCISLNGKSNLKHSIHTQLYYVLNEFEWKYIKQLQLNASKHKTIDKSSWWGLLGVKHYLLKTWFTKYLNWFRLCASHWIERFIAIRRNHSANWISEFLNFYLNNCSDKFWMKTGSHTGNFSFFQFSID